MIPSIVQVCQAVLAADDEENIKHTFDVLDSLSLSVSLLPLSTDLD